MRLQAWRPALEAFRELVFPATCVHCKTLGSTHPLCHSCLGSLRRMAAEPACPLCGALIVLDDAGCQRCLNKGLPHLKRIYRFAVYTGPARTLLLRAKFSKEWPLMEYLTQLAREDADLQSHLTTVDALVPIPLHPRRLWTRGYNQADLIARTLRADAPIIRDLRRTRHTPAQSKQASAAARKKNVADAFTVLNPHSFKDRRVLLIDDILTTGATLIEAARTLKRARAREVSAFALATTDPRTTEDS